jgi:CheY-like chemotaxis protein
VSKTLLAVDDSNTMRKVLEITFGADDYTVVTADNQANALAKLTPDTSVVVIDTALGGDDGYALAKEVRQRNAAAAIILMSSKFNAYDAAKGKDSGADDFIDKPFDTQAAIDKVRKVLLSKGAAPAEAAKPVEAAPAPKPVEAAPAPKPVEAPVAAPKPAAAAPASARAPSMPAAAAPVAAAVNSGMATKLGDLGLSTSQIDAVMALSRDVVERVVWEVVPALAEALIKEEITRLTKEA